MGVRDWELKRFHGEEISTHRGSTYNAYIVKDRRTALVDTVWTPFHESFVADLDREIGLRNVSLIVVNHTEQDHAGSLRYLMERIPDTPIYCTRNGLAMIEGHFHRKWNVNVVRTGDSVDLGDYRLVFVEMPMLHWPDSMATYVTGANVLLSNDAFGQHYVAPHLFNDEVDQAELWQEALKYYANILTPFSDLVKKKIDEIKSLGLPIDMIAPSHGVIWRDNPMQIVEKYAEWADGYHEGTVVVLYDTMWGATRKMAMAIARGVERKGLGARLINIGKSDRSDVMVEIFKARAVVLGSSTINRGLLADAAAVLEMMRGLRFKGKIGAAFGSYGWSGESPKVIEERLAEAGVELVAEALRVKHDPTEEDLRACESLGEKVADRISA